MRQMVQGNHCPPRCHSTVETGVEIHACRVVTVQWCVCADNFLGHLWRHMVSFGIPCRMARNMVSSVSMVSLVSLAESMLSWVSLVYAAGMWQG